MVLGCELHKASSRRIVRFQPVGSDVCSFPSSPQRATRQSEHARWTGAVPPHKTRSVPPPITHFPLLTPFRQALFDIHSFCFSAAWASV